MVDLRDTAMALRFDPVFIDSGGFVHLMKTRESVAARLADKSERAGKTMFHPVDVEHFNRIFKKLEGDDEAKSTLMAYLNFAQTKSDCAGF